MNTVASAVTSERFDKAQTYAEYVASVTVNRDQFERYYDMARLSEADVAFFQKAAALPSGPAKILVIAEAWCPDVYRGVPVFARIAEASGMTLRVVLRDENPAIMDQFLLHGKSRAIPVAVFYAPDLHYITHFTERPAAAHEIVARLRAELATLHPNADVPTMKAFFGERLTPLYPEWQVDTVREIRNLLSTALHL